MDRSGRHLLGLINDVLDLLKIEAGELVLSVGDVAVGEVIQVVCSALEPLAAEKRLRLVADVAADLPLLRGDERRITQVLLNLAGNAVKFTETGEVKLSARASHGALLLSVSDTGPGIAERDRQRIFEEFQQAGGSGRQNTPGTGLGLATAKHIVELHGGRIWVESQPGSGSTFTFSLPAGAERGAAVA